MCPFILEVPKERIFCIANSKYLVIIILNVIITSNMTTVEPSYTAHRSFLVILVHCNFDIFQSFLSAACSPQRLPCLLALRNKVFMGLASGKRAQSHKCSSPGSSTTPPLSGCGGEGARTTKGFSPGRFPSPVQQVGPRWAPDSWVHRVILLLCLITSCFLCLFVFLDWFPVLLISQLVLPCLFCVSCVFLQVTLLLSTGRLMSVLCSL